MSRNFEDEYKNMMADEVPDLWSRIEGNLKEKNGVSENSKPEQQMPETQIPELTKVSKEKEKKLTKIYIKKYAVAACLCLVIVVGGAITIFKGNAGKSSDATAEMEMTNEIACDSVEMTEDAAETTESAVDQAGMETDDAAEEAVKESVKESVAEDALRAPQSNLNANKSEGADTTHADSASGDQTAEEPAESGAQALECENINYQAVVRITSVENTGEEILYYAEVLPSVYSVFEPESVLIFCIGDMEITEPEIGKSYKISVDESLKEESSQNVYMLKGIQEQEE